MGLLLPSCVGTSIFTERDGKKRARRKTTQLGAPPLHYPPPAPLKQCDKPKLRVTVMFKCLVRFIPLLYQPADPDWNKYCTPFNPDYTTPAGLDHTNKKKNPNNLFSRFKRQTGNFSASTFCIGTEYAERT